MTMSHVTEERCDCHIDFEDIEMETNLIGKYVDTVWKKLYSLTAGYQTVLRRILLTGLVCLWHFYVAAAWMTSKGSCLDLCEDVGLLYLLTLLTDLGLAYFLILKPVCWKLRSTQLATRLLESVVRPIESLMSSTVWLDHTNTVVTVTFLVSLATFVIVDTADQPARLVSAGGVLVLVLVCLVLSNHPTYIVWRPVLWGLGLQVVFGLIILRWQPGKSLFDCLGRKVTTFLDFTDAGSGFVFGYLVTLQPFDTAALNSTVSRTVAEDINNSNSIGFIFFFKVLSIIYFFNFVVSILFYLGAMTWLVGKLGWLLQVSLGTTACESVNAAANIFLGQTEAPLLIKPYLAIMTQSEIHAVMTGGFATIAGKGVVETLTDSLHVI